MKVLIVSATVFEILPLQNYLERFWTKERDSVYSFKSNELTLLIAGVGITATTYSLMKVLNQSNYDVVLNAGIAGTFDPNIALGEVVQVTSESFGDLGVEEQNGAFTDVFELGLIESNEPPFVHSTLWNQDSEALLEGYNLNLKPVKGLTVHKVHGSADSIKAITNKYQVDIETMEGAAVFYVCLQEQIPFVEIRSISNYVEPRNKDNWKIEQAIEALNKCLIDLIKQL